MEFFHCYNKEIEVNYKMWSKCTLKMQYNEEIVYQANYIYSRLIANSKNKAIILKSMKKYLT